MRPCRGHWRVILGSCGVIGVMCGSFEGHKEGLGLFSLGFKRMVMMMMMLVVMMLKFATGGIEEVVFD